MFHTELYQQGDLFEGMAGAVEKIMVAIGADNILAAGKDPVFTPTGVTADETNGLSEVDKAELFLERFVRANAWFWTQIRKMGGKLTVTWCETALPLHSVLLAVLAYTNIFPK